MITIFGPAGSGKSLQGQLLAEKYGWKWLSVGQLLRDQNDAAITEKQERGELFDDEFVTKLMHDTLVELETAGKKVILDGYPRNLAQAEWIDKNGDIKKIEGVVVLEVAEEELWKRLEGRGRSDDTRDAVKRRWEIFEQNIYSILPLIEANNVKITTLDGAGTVEEVTARIEAVLSDWGILDAATIIGSEERDGVEKSYGE